MSTVQLTFENCGDLPADLANKLSRADQDDATLSVQELVQLLDVADDDAVGIETPVRHPDWERGEPCPECGEPFLSVMVAEENLYFSEDGDFGYQQNETVVGGVELSVFCTMCETHLRDVPRSGF